MPFTRVNTALMDCKRFRKQHLAYLDDTMPGDEMAAAQHHVMVCDGCAAHDTLVRRSLMVARSMPVLEPSAAFQARLRARLAECRDECRDDCYDERYDGRTAMAARSALLHAPRSAASRNRRVAVAVAASAMLGAFVWQGWSTPAPELSMQPVIASQPASPMPVSYIAPELMQAMATGNPVWPAAMVIEDAPAPFVRSDFTLATFSQLR